MPRSRQARRTQKAIVNCGSISEDTERSGVSKRLEILEEQKDEESQHSNAPHDYRGEVLA